LKDQLKEMQYKQVSLYDEYMLVFQIIDGSVES